MNWTPPRWQTSPNTSHPDHSTKELENRLTTLEVKSEDHGEQIDGHSERLTLHERAILAILGSIYVLAQDKFPALAELIRGLTR